MKIKLKKDDFDSRPTPKLVKFSLILTIIVGILIFCANAAKIPV